MQCQPKAFLQTSSQAAMLFQPSKQHQYAKNYFWYTVTTIF